MAFRPLTKQGTIMGRREDYRQVLSKVLASVDNDLLQELINAVPMGNYNEVETGWRAHEFCIELIGSINTEQNSRYSAEQEIDKMMKEHSEEYDQGYDPVNPLISTPVTASTPNDS